MSIIKRKPKEERQPKLQDLRDSGEIEQSARKVLMLYNKDAKKQNEIKDVDVYVAKNDDGSCIVKGFKFDTKKQKFMEISKQYWNFIDFLMNIYYNVFRKVRGVVMIYLKLYDITTGKTFTKYFDCEFDKQKFKRKLKFSKKIFIRDESI